MFVEHVGHFIILFSVLFYDLTASCYVLRTYSIIMERGPFYDLTSKQVICRTKMIQEMNWIKKTLIDKLENKTR